MGPRVHVAQGDLEGIVEDGISKFLGIPYAAPPTGDLRWAATEPPAAWQGIREAKQFGPICPQTRGATSSLRQEEQSEDCLFLNVWTSAADSAPAADPADPRHVMVWIHGGGNLGGAGSELDCDGTSLAQGGAVVVTFNYRLGALGFLAHRSIGANFGTLDQAAALRWVSRNISAFGGDPHNVTSFGESSGAEGVRSLMSCPSAEGLFQRAILESAGFETAVCHATRTYEEAHESAEALFDALGTSQLASLRQKSIDAVMKASDDLCGIPPPPGTFHTPADLVWTQVVDGAVIAQRKPLDWTMTVPVLLGCNANEARYFLKLPPDHYSSDDVEGLGHALYAAKAQAALSLPELAGMTPYEKLDRLFTAVIFHEPAAETARLFAAQGLRVYTFQFGRCCPGMHASKELAKHTAEIPYVFGNLALFPDNHYDDTDHRLSKGMQHAWLTFARTGRPELMDGSTWPEFHTQELLTLHIRDTVEIRALDPSALRDLVSTLRQT